jgi:hypothetical protein
MRVKVIEKWRKYVLDVYEFLILATLAVMNMFSTCYKGTDRDNEAGWNKDNEASSNRQTAYKQLNAENTL